VVVVGRIAGQFAKPRTSPIDRVNGMELPPFRGHIVNAPEPDAEARRPDPARMLHAYEQSVQAADELRRLPERVWVSHEALLLPYEEALCRRDPDSGRWFAGSGHLLWVGERTRQPESAQVEFLSGVANPLACKLGPGATPDEALAICGRLNPDNLEGRLALVTRLGATAVADRLPPLVEAVESAGRQVTWVCDPMHGNTVATPSGVRTRPLSAILDELEAFCRIHQELGTVVGGVHLEMTPDPVTECADVGVVPEEYDPRPRFSSLMDPRMNPAQAVQVVDHLAALLG
jgi:3-deoxy-7-phosphoheptulonate synthase